MSAELKTIKFDKCNCRVVPGQFNLNNISLNCDATWNLISSGFTIGVFQLEKKLGQEWAKKSNPNNIEELAALTSILRPGPLESNMSQDYVDVKNGKKEISYIHPSLKIILDKTYGSLVYQEQAIRIAVDLAGFSLESADDLRKAMGKKLPELMAKMKKKFIEGSEQKGIIDKKTAETIFGWIEKAQRYSFNKSHAVSYGILSYTTAWLKCHFPREFYTSYLTYSQYKGDPKEEIYKLVQDARLFGIQILPPNIIRGNIYFEMTNEDDNGIAFGLSNIKGVGQSAIKRILYEDKSFTKKRILKNWYEFLEAVPDFHRHIGAALIKSGACDCYNRDRSEMLKELEITHGKSIIDENLKKKDIKGLTKREKEFFFQKLKDNFEPQQILSDMLEYTNDFVYSIDKFKKGDLIKLVVDRLKNFKELKTEEGIFVWTNEYELSKFISKLSKNSIKDLLILNNIRKQENDYFKLSPTRVSVIKDKLSDLSKDVEDTNFANSEGEKHFLGISISCSPTDDVYTELSTHTCLEAAKESIGNNVCCCCIIDNVKPTKTKRGSDPGRDMCFLTVSDSTYCLDSVVLFPDSYEKLKDFCIKDKIVLLYAKKSKNGSLVVDNIESIL